MRLQFPHIPRIITAGATWGLFLMLVAVNMVTLASHPLAYSDKIFQVLTRPVSGLAHKDLAQALWSTGMRSLAKQELAIAEELSPVLGVDTTQKEREAAQITYWQDIASAHPDYRDAFIQLARFSYAQGNLAETKKYLTQAAALDPNGKTVRGLLKFISP